MLDDATPALKPCPNPWCASTTAPVPVSGLIGWRVVCACGVQAWQAPTMAEAVTAWNARAESQSELLEALRPFGAVPAEKVAAIVGAVTFVALDARNTPCEAEAYATAEVVTRLAIAFRQARSAISRAEGLGVEGGLKEGIAVSRTIQSSPSGDPQARLSDGKGEP